MPNGAQTPTEEGEASGGESQDEEEWDSDVAGDDDDDEVRGKFTCARSGDGGHASTEEGHTRVMNDSPDRPENAAQPEKATTPASSDHSVPEAFPTDWTRGLVLVAQARQRR